MHYKKHEAIKDSLHKTQARLFLLTLFSLVFLFISKDEAIIYMAISLSPSETVGEYEKTVEVNEYRDIYRTDLYFTYSDSGGVLYSYIASKYMINSDNEDFKKISLIYSEKFPHISYLSSYFKYLKSDFYMFFGACFFTFIFLIRMFIVSIKIYKSENT